MRQGKIKSLQDPRMPKSEVEVTICQAENQAPHLLLLHLTTKFQTCYFLSIPLSFMSFTLVATFILRVNKRMERLISASQEPQPVHRVLQYSFSVHLGVVPHVGSIYMEINF